VHRATLDGRSPGLHPLSLEPPQFTNLPIKFARAAENSLSSEDSKQVKSILVTIIDSLISSTGRPDEAGEAFTASLQTVHSRIESESLAEITEDDRIFTASPDALVHWAPIVDELKVLDEGIVRNSIRFRWQETRRELKRHLNRQAVIASVAH